MPDVRMIPVENLQGDEVTEWGKVKWTTQEPDGVDVQFEWGNDPQDAHVHHFDYGKKLAVRV